MGISRYESAKRLLDKVVEMHGRFVTFEILKGFIIKFIGSDESRTVKPYMRLMIETKLITTEGNDLRING